MQDEHNVLEDLRLQIAGIVGETDPTAEGTASPQHRPSRNPGGAPKGNQNARKHGLYSRLLPPERREEVVEEMTPKSLTPEIDAVRIKLAELMADPAMKISDLLPTLRVLAQLVSVNQKFSTIGR